jgi:hypothetical protein
MTALRLTALAALAGLLVPGFSCGESDADLGYVSGPAALTRAAADSLDDAPEDLAAAFDSSAVSDPETAATYQAILDKAASDGVAERPYGEIVQWVGEQLLGRPYAAGMLDAPAEETLIVDLRRFDCVLYIENVLAIARAIATVETSYAAYADGVRTLRYRDGEQGGYCSRLHYFSDWIADNESRGALQNVTRAIGGEAFPKTLDFMSTHRSSYPRLASDSVYACVVGTEQALRGLQLFYIPQARIAAAYAQMQPGDIIATATSVGGLDVTHTGFVHKTARGTGFMHASQASDEVIVSPDLQAYVQGIRSQVGVIVARPVDPR